MVSAGLAGSLSYATLDKSPAYQTSLEVFPLSAFLFHCRGYIAVLLINAAETAPEINNAVARKMNVDAPPSAILIPHAIALAVLNPLVEIAIVS